MADGRTFKVDVSTSLDEAIPPGGSPEIRSEWHADHFFQVPLRVLEALKSGDLTFTQFGLLCFVVSEIDFRSGQVIGTLRALADGCGWTRSPDWLRKNLVLVAITALVLVAGAWTDLT